MGAFTFVITRLGYTLIQVIEFAMMARAILSWFPFEEDNKFLAFLDAVTEPFIYPIRRLFDRFGWFQGLPIDIAFFVTYLILVILSTLLGHYGF